MTNLRSALDLAVRLHREGNLHQAEAAYRQVLYQWPGQPDALNLLGVLAQQVGRTDVGLELIGQAIAQRPNEPHFHGNLATTLEAAGRIPDAIQHYREAIRLKPDAGTYRVLLSEVLQQQGQLDEALSVALEALRFDPNSAETNVVLGNLAAIGRYDFTEADIKRMQGLLDRGGQVAADACLLCFTLAAHWERTGRFDEAFACYRRANDFKLQVYRQENKAFDQEKHRALIGSLIAAFTPEFFERTRTFGSASETPVFVVGLVRSGTTLVEQILASHPEVHGAGERIEIHHFAITLHTQVQATQAYPGCVGRLGPGLARSLANDYLQRLARYAGTANRIVDKMPHNYLHLGLIAMLFPRARIIHCRRDPMDVCASAYFQNFKIMPHAASLEDIAFYHHQYAKLMEHWQRVLPLPIHEVVYEELVADTETVSRKLVSSCGLKWDERCLAFHRNKRLVQTASKLQVRQPIYHRSVGRWKHFESHLESLRLALGVANRCQHTDDSAKTVAYDSLLVKGPSALTPS